MTGNETPGRGRANRTDCSSMAGICQSEEWETQGTDDWQGVARAAVTSGSYRCTRWFWDGTQLTPGGGTSTGGFSVQCSRELCAVIPRKGAAVTACALACAQGAARGGRAPPSLPFLTAQLGNKGWVLAGCWLKTEAGFGKVTGSTRVSVPAPEFVTCNTRQWSPQRRAAETVSATPEPEQLLAGLAHRGTQGTQKTTRRSPAGPGGPTRKHWQVDGGTEQMARNPCENTHGVGDTPRPTRASGYSWDLPDVLQVFSNKNGYI